MMVPSSAALILTPTAGERAALQAAATESADGSIAWAGRLELCGFGIAVAAARTASLIAQYQPTEVWLVGIAGVYPRFADRYPLGSAVVFGNVACDGIGAGAGDAFESAGQMGFPQWPDPSRPINDEVLSAAGDSEALRRLANRDPGWQQRQVLTVCSAAATTAEVERRQRAHPAAVAEEMEGFGVAVACHLAGIPFGIIRGLSNVAGVRDKQQWQIQPALKAAAELLASLVACSPD